MIWRIDVFSREDSPDGVSARALEALRRVGLEGITGVSAARVYLVDGDLDRSHVEKAASTLFMDPVIHGCTITPASEPPPKDGKGSLVLIFKKTGVMDPVEASTQKALRDLGLEARHVRTGMKFQISGSVREAALRTAVLKTLANDVVDEVVLGERTFERIGPAGWVPSPTQEIRILDVSEEALFRIGEERSLALTAAEWRAIRDHFKGLRRNPTDVELETIAQTWSEHCKHKTFNAEIHADGERIDGLLKSTIMRATFELAKPWCLSVFRDNAGVIEFDERHAICFKVETHNHPSAIEPYGGANTGLGGVIRDVMGCGLGAKPVANTDVFCVAPPDLPAQRLPAGVISPDRILKGVVAGVRDYGNRMGIPTVNGAVYFDERYAGNPLVYCGTVGLLPKTAVLKEVRPGDRIVSIGGRTGRDGIHGATFSSTRLMEASERISSGAVQIGNAIVQKRMLDVLLQARDRGLYRSITDCGAGGLSSAVGEMGADHGAQVELERVPLKYEGLSASEIWISEAQERMVLAVPPEKVQELCDLCRREDVEATDIGHFDRDGMLTLRYAGRTVASLSMKFLHQGVPRVRRKAVQQRYPQIEPKIPENPDYGMILRRLLSSWNVCSKEWIVRQYDHEVQGGSVVKPLVGIMNDGPGDAAVIRPLLWSYRGIALGCGMNPSYGDIDPYAMAASAIDEAIRNVIAVGGNPDRTALLDNFSWGNPDDPVVLGALVSAAKACYDTAKAYGTPFISGKDSLNNEYHSEGRRIIIPHSLLISAVSVVEDVRACVSMDAKEAENFIYIVGTTRNELGGSRFYALWDGLGASVPTVDFVQGKRVFDAVAQAIRLGLVRAAHDVSEGGLAVAAVEMAFAGGLGMELDAAKVPTDSDVVEDYQVLFSESNTRFLLEVRPKDVEAFEAALKGVSFSRIGMLTSFGRLMVRGRKGGTILSETIESLKEAWQSTLRW